MVRHTNRRTFLRDSFLVSAGVIGGSLILRAIDRAGAIMANSAVADEVGQALGPEQRLRDLGIKLPPAPKPVAVYFPSVRTGRTLYVSGHIPRRADGRLIQGKVGSELTLDEGYEAARLVGLNVLSTVRDSLGSLDKVARLVKVLGMVNCTPDFTKHPQVINGFSELMVQVFGETRGKAARSAAGLGSLPSNIPVEVEAIFEVRK